MIVKYRAWDFRANTISQVAGIEFDRLGNLDRIFLHNADGSLLCDPDRVHLLQWTGLKDKHKKDIYEGHVVRAWSEGVCGTFVVRWRQEGTPCWILFPAWQNTKLWTLKGTKTKDGYVDSVEILGNIVQHHHLIEPVVEGKKDILKLLGVGE